MRFWAFNYLNNKIKFFFLRLKYIILNFWEKIIGEFDDNTEDCKHEAVYVPSVHNYVY